MLLLAVMIPFWTSFVVRTYGIYNLINFNGPLYQLLHALGLVHGYIHLLFTPIGVGIGIVYSYLPLMILPLFVSLERIDPALLEAASDLGATPFSEAPPRDAAAGGAGDHRRVHPGRRSRPPAST